MHLCSDCFGRNKIRVSTVVFLLLELLCGISLVQCLLRKQWVLALTCIANLLLMLLPWVAERWLGIMFTDCMRTILYVYLFCCITVGTVWDVYYKTGNFDILMHGVAGFLFAAIGFSLFSIMHPGKESPGVFYLALMAFCFSLAVSLVWELYEFGMMSVFHMDMQRDSVLDVIATSYFTNQDAVSDVLHITETTLYGDFGTRTIPGFLDMGYIDTMTDVLIETVGAVVFSVWACLKPKGVLEKFLPVRSVPAAE